MMEGWKNHKLGEILELVYGKSLPKTKRTNGSIPVFGSNGIVGYHNQAFVFEPGIIVGRKGSAGNVAFSKVPFCPIDTTFYITQKETELDLMYLYYALTNLNLKRILGDVGVPGLNLSVFTKCDSVLKTESCKMPAVFFLTFQYNLITIHLTFSLIYFFYHKL